MSARRRSGIPSSRVGGLLQFGVDQLERFRRSIGAAPPARSVDQAPPRRLREPPFRVRGHALVRPYGKRRGEGVGERVFGSRHVARRRREIGDELAVALARHAGGDRASLSVAARRPLGREPSVGGRGVFVFAPVISIACRDQALRIRSRLSRGQGCMVGRRDGTIASVNLATSGAPALVPTSRERAYISQIGRTSTAPCCAEGHRAAHEIAASRSGALMRK